MTFRAALLAISFAPEVFNVTSILDMARLLTNMPASHNARAHFFAQAFAGWPLHLDFCLVGMILTLEFHPVADGVRCLQNLLDLLPHVGLGAQVGHVAHDVEADLSPGQGHADPGVDAQEADRAGLRVGADQ